MHQLRPDRLSVASKASKASRASKVSKARRDRRTLSSLKRPLSRTGSEHKFSYDETWSQLKYNVHFWLEIAALVCCIVSTMTDFPVCSWSYMAVYTCQVLGSNAFCLIMSTMAVLRFVGETPSSVFCITMDIIGAVFCLSSGAVDVVSWLIVDLEYAYINVTGACFLSGFRVTWLFNLMAGGFFLIDIYCYESRWFKI